MTEESYLLSCTVSSRIKGTRLPLRSVCGFVLSENVNQEGCFLEALPWRAVSLPIDQKRS